MVRPRTQSMLVRLSWCLLTIAALGAAHSQGVAFGDASLRGTYGWVLVVSAGADAPIPSDVNGGSIYYAGDGTYRGISMFNNNPGAPDADGNPTRDVRNQVDDPSTWSRWEGTYDVNPHGGILWTWPLGDFDGVATGAEVIDGVLTITEYVLVARVANAQTGGVWMFRHERLADADLLPPPEGED